MFNASSFDRNEIDTDNEFPANRNVDEAIENVAEKTSLFLVPFQSITIEVKLSQMQT